mgnify:CR=1 FL=1
MLGRLATCKPLQIQNISYELVDFFGFRAPRRADADADVVVVNRSHGFKDVFAFQGLGLSSRKDDELLVRRADDEFFYPFLPEGWRIRTAYSSARFVMAKYVPSWSRV